MDYVDTDGHLAYQQEKAYGGRARDCFEDHFIDWTMDYFRDYILHDVFAYQELIVLMGEVGKTLPTDTEELSPDQEDTLLELGQSQYEWNKKFEDWSYQDYISRRGEPDND